MDYEFHTGLRRTNALIPTCQPHEFLMEEFDIYILVFYEWCLLTLTKFYRPPYIARPIPFMIFRISLTTNHPYVLIFIYTNAQNSIKLVSFTKHCKPQRYHYGSFNMYICRLISVAAVFIVHLFVRGENGYKRIIFYKSKNSKCIESPVMNITISSSS